ncbi:MAG TPA: type 1 glutamine amidotransferase domain-containing protein, partial [Flavobacteriia bacterium]|nr:type 1 glutamine amidotransferase domain-containing protein [Flavobacteriia bacterium]
HKLSNIDIKAYDAIFFPGGLGLMTDMVDNALVKETIKEVYESNKVVGAICHGPTALLNVTLSDGSNLVEGKKINSFTAAEENIDNHKLGSVIPFMLDDELAKQGAIFLSGEPFEPYVVTDGNLITGQNPASASAVAQAMIALMAE